ncbi:MAG: hydrogenase/urease accessory protein HupE [Glaciecola sp.]|jgi:hydrogenase/urease accessory protein HupE
MRLILNIRTLTTLLFLLLPIFAYGDGFTRGVFQLSQAELENQYEFIAEFPASKNSEKLITWPQGCMPLQTNQYQPNDIIIQTYLIDCDARLVSGDIITVPYEVEVAIFDIQLGAWQSRTIAASSNAGFQLVLQTDQTIDRALPDIAKEYLHQGMMHIWFGWDHLAFVLCLCLLIAGFRQLFWTITAFTIGHSVSMALSFFKLVNIAIPPVEAIIAMSIVMIAREAWFQINYGEPPNKAKQGRILLVVVLFGLIHGLGFASALENIGVVGHERIPALVFFNLGVEFGQVVFVLLIFALLKLLRKAQKAQIFARAALILVGSAGSFWAIERISEFNW